MMSNNIIQTFDLTKIYNLKGRNKVITALNNVNISIRKNEIFGLLGPNGAGKTTLVQILTTLLRPTSGYATIDGFDIIKRPNKAKNRVALMLESDMLYYRITAYANLKFFCKIYNIPNYKQKITKMAEEFGLHKWLNQYVENFSSGMKMKLALLRTLLLNRDILFLDEPTLGLDVKSVNFIVQKIKDYNKTIFLTSHDMSVVEKLCDRIAFIDKGAILKIGTQNELKDLMQKEIKIKLDIYRDRKKLIEELNKTEFIKEIYEGKESLVISIKERANYKDLFFILSKYHISKIKELDFSLEDLFLKLIR